MNENDIYIASRTVTILRVEQYLCFASRTVSLSYGGFGGKTLSLSYG